MMKISVLGIGTELTTGQILNRNGSWISSQLMAMGVPTALHLVVPDDRDLILQSLQFCWQNSDLVFVTGGLGPTSDDFTREVMAQWTDRKLEWHEPSWQHIRNRLLPRGIPVRDIQKQQCYFPEGSLVLQNEVGTANAFQLDHQGKTIFVLPGPPGEIASIWKDHIEAPLRHRARDVDPLVTMSWDTIGLGESEIAERAEQALKGCSYEKAYRVHLPFVEFKITHLKSQQDEAKKWIQAIEKVLGPVTVLRQGQDAAQTLLAQLNQLLHSTPESNVVICDEIPGSFLFQRIFPHCKELLKQRKLNFVQSLDVQELRPSTLLLELKEDSVGSAQASWTFKGQRRKQNFMSPYKSGLLREREQQFYAEMALIFWMKEVSDGTANSSKLFSSETTFGRS